MKIEVLDSKKYNVGTCFLCKVNLLEYVKGIKDNYQEYEVQRGIVKNSYLDSLYRTLENVGHIPLITLVTDDNLSTNSKNIQDWEILDGLQRTHRLKVIYDTSKFIEANRNKLPTGTELRENLQILNSDLKTYNFILSSPSAGAGIEGFLKDNYLWIEIWKDLDLNQQIEKMLLLNAGHKSVSTKHQIEIIFAHLIPKLKKSTALKNVKIFREKDLTSATYTKNRKSGEFFFSHIITGTYSYLLGEPVTANASFINKIQNSDEVEEHELSRINGKLIIDICEFLTDFDKIIYKEYGEDGIKWLGKEVVINAVFGALGDLSKNNEDDTVLDQFISNFKKYPANLPIPNYEKEKLKIDFSKVNLGLAQKNAIFEAIQNFMKNPTKKITSWQFK